MPMIANSRGSKTLTGAASLKHRSAGDAFFVRDIAQS